MGHVRAPGVVVQSSWKHWPCLFPQHGPGRKHEWLIALEDWQAEVIQAFPSPRLEIQRRPGPLGPEDLTQRRR